MSSDRRYLVPRQQSWNKHHRPRTGNSSTHSYYSRRPVWPTFASPKRSVIGLRPSPMSDTPSLRPILPRPHGFGSMAGALSQPTRVMAPPPIRVHPDTKRILDTYQKTLGLVPNQYDSAELILLPFADNKSLETIYGQHIEEVKQFRRNLDLFSNIPPNDMEENLSKNWLEVLVLRSCWWFTYIDEDEMDVIRVGDKYGLHRGSNKALEPLYGMAETINEMNLHAIELALTSTYLLLMGSSSFMRSKDGSVSATARIREHVLKLLYSYQKEHYPYDELRYVQLLTYLSELTFIARSI